MRVLLSLLALIVLAVSTAVAQDPVVADADHIKLVFENDQVRVLRYSYKPGDKSPIHEHPANVIIALSDQDAKSTVNGKTTDVHFKAGEAVWRGPTKHIFENTGTTPAEGILVEPKGAGNAAWTPPPRDSLKTAPETHKLEFENDKVRVVRVHYEPGEKGPMHDHPDQVQIWLTDADIPITLPDGRTQVGHVKAGLARWWNAFSHKAENVSDKPFEYVSVELKGAPPAKTANK